ncbi:MAG: hypothetical protein J6Y00_00710 [Paludibacteraceae bacterium]|nr:hypothetical protein [Bacteroidales bacterium]MBP5476197.1 hypothetical protein [Paludibacteraceae bacterium]
MLSDKSLKTFCVNPKDEENWRKLFEQIVYVYKYRNRYPTKQQIETYLFELESIPQRESIEVRNYWHSEKTNILNDRLSIFLLYSENLKILLEQTAKVEWFYEEYKEQVVRLCRKFIHILMSEFSEMDFEDAKNNTREYRLIQTFDCIHNYLESKGESALFLPMCLRRK